MIVRAIERRHVGLVTTVVNIFPLSFELLFEVSEEELEYKQLIKITNIKNTRYASSKYNYFSIFSVYVKEINGTPTKSFDSNFLLYGGDILRSNERHGHGRFIPIPRRFSDYWDIKDGDLLNVLITNVKHKESDKND